MLRPKYLILPLLFTFTVAACEEERKKKKSNDDDAVATDDDTGVGGSAVTTTTGSGGGSCTALCNNAASASCPGFDSNQCLSECDAIYQGAPSACVPALDALVGCWSTATPVCEAEGVSFTGCEAELESYSTCLSNPTTTTTTGAGGGGPTGWCYEGGGSCNPMGPLCGGSGSACDVGEAGFTCYEDGNTQGLGQSCGETGYCQHGLTCYQGFCSAYCCDNADCGGGTCQAIGTAGTTEVRICL